MASVSSIHPELIEPIVYFLRHDRKALRACRLTSKAFCQSATPRLFAYLAVGSRSREDLSVFYQISSFVRSIRVEWYSEGSALQVLSPPPDSISPSPLKNLTSITHYGIPYNIPLRNIDFIGWEGPVVLTELNLERCRIPALSTLTKVLDICRVLETFTFCVMYLDGYMAPEDPTHQLRSPYLRKLVLVDRDRDNGMEYLMRWFAKLSSHHSQTQNSCLRQSAKSALNVISFVGRLPPNW